MVMLIVTSIAFFQLGSSHPQPVDEESCVNLMWDYLSGTGPLAIDVETVSLEERTPIGISVSPDPNCSFYFPMFPEMSPYIPWEILRDPSRLKVFHNVMFDIDVLDGAIPPVHLFDTMMACRYNGLPLALGTLADPLGLHIESISEILPKGKNMLDIPEELVVRKCSKDTIATFRLWEKIHGETNPSVMAVDMDLIPLFLHMGRRGVAIDQTMLMEFVEKYTKEVNYFRAICEGYGFNPSSTMQRGYILADRGNQLPLTRKHRQLQTTEKILRKLEDPLAAIILNHDIFKNMLSKGLNSLIGHNRARGKYGFNSETGRTTCSSGDKLPGFINFQQLFKKDFRREIRQIFMPDKGMWTDFDDSQIELRVLAYLSQDRNMLDVFESGGDIHADTMERCNIARPFAKNVNYAMPYGGGDETMAESANMSIEMAGRIRAIWNKAYPQAFSYMEEQKDQGNRYGYVDDIYGRRYHLEEKYGEDKFAIGRKAINYPIQGTASRIFKEQMLVLWRKDKEYYDIAIESHDEVVIDGKVDLPVEELENIAPFKTPIEIKYLKRWE